MAFIITRVVMMRLILAVLMVTAVPPTMLFRFMFWLRLSSHLKVFS